MPYKLRKAPNRDLYWVVGEDGTKHSKEPLPRERAEAQMRALYSAMRGGVSMSKKAFVKEHEHLIKVLNSGKRSDLVREARDQSKELRKIRGGATPRERGNASYLRQRYSLPNSLIDYAHTDKDGNAFMVRELVNNIIHSRTLNPLSAGHPMVRVLNATGVDELDRLFRAYISEITGNAWTLKDRSDEEPWDGTPDHFFGSVASVPVARASSAEARAPIGSEPAKPVERAKSSDVAKEPPRKAQPPPPEEEVVVRRGGPPRMPPSRWEGVSDEDKAPSPVSPKTRKPKSPSASQESEVEAPPPAPAPAPAPKPSAPAKKKETPAQKKKREQDEREEEEMKMLEEEAEKGKKGRETLKKTLIENATKIVETRLKPLFRRKHENGIMSKISYDGFNEMEKQLRDLVKQKEELVASKDMDPAKLRYALNEIDETIKRKKKLGRSFSDDNDEARDIGVKVDKELKMLLDGLVNLFREKLGTEEGEAEMLKFNETVMRPAKQRAIDEVNEAQKGKGRYRGAGPIPSRSLLQQMAEASYSQSPPQKIDTLQLLRATPTLKFYKDGDTIVVAIRGTVPTNGDDVKADALIAVGQLESSSRYKNDEATLRDLQTQFPPTQFDYYGVGHSLGGAILDLFLKKGFLKNGVSYNPAVQPTDFANTTLPNERIYQSGDPLLGLMGRHLEKKPEVRTPRKKNWWEKAISFVPYAGKAYDYYADHRLSNFVGGGGKKFMTQLRKAGIEPSSYLKEAQRRAKEAGLAYKLLGFADDGVHKLAIPDENGKVERFGKVGYGDFLIWSHLERAQSVPKGTSAKYRERFRKSHSKMPGDWKRNPYSPNNLAIQILW